MSSEKLLVIFVKNARMGKVKTRLAATIGDENALKIYIHLLNHTAEICAEVNAHRAVFYSDMIEEADEFMVPHFQKYLQNGSDLGEKMMNAFLKGFAKGYEKILIIGSDCYELNTGIIEQGFKALEDHDTVIGPASDGGYYLLGMKKLNKQLFQNKEWSTNNVLLDTLLDFKNLGLTYTLLPTLTDVDEEKDLGELRNFVLR